MLRKAVYLTLIGLTAGLFSVVALAGNGIQENGKHTNINIIGHPNADDFDADSEWGGGNSSSSGGGTIFIPLQTEKRPRKMHKNSNNEWVCTDLVDGTQTVYEAYDSGLATTTEPEGNTRIYFDPVDSDKVVITDRDATDGAARINMPVGSDGFVTVRMYVRVLGKPGGCAEITGYATEEDGLEDGIDLWWYAGSIDVQRKKGKSAFVDATDIFSVVYCEDPVQIGSTDHYECNGSTETLSVFDPRFLEYFWEVNNHNTKLIQLRFYYD